MDGRDDDSDDDCNDDGLWYPDGNSDNGVRNAVAYEEEEELLESMLMVRMLMACIVVLCRK